MSSPTPDALKAEIDAGKMKIGNTVVSATGTPVTANTILYNDSSSQLEESLMTASTPMYVNSAALPTSGTVPFSLPVSSSTSTTGTFLTLTGYSTLSGTNDLGTTLVAGASVTAFTATGYVRVSIVDSGGNLTDGDHYIQLGSLT